MSDVKLPRWQTPERKAYMKAWHAENPRDRRAYKRDYDARNRERHAAWRADNKAKLKAKSTAYYLANRDRLIAHVKARDAADPERVSAYHADHYARNSDRIKANVAAYQKANPEKVATLMNRRRVRKAGNGGFHTAEEWAAKLEDFGHKCCYCGRGGKMTRDHKVSIKRGGTDDISNIVPACRPCNSRKNANPLEVFLSRIGIKPTDYQRYVGR